MTIAKVRMIIYFASVNTTIVLQIILQANHFTSVLGQWDHFRGAVWNGSLYCLLFKQCQYTEQLNLSCNISELYDLSTLEIYNPSSGDWRDIGFHCEIRTLLWLLGMFWDTAGKGKNAKSLLFFYWLFFYFDFFWCSEAFHPILYLLSKKRKE